MRRGECYCVHAMCMYVCVCIYIYIYIYNRTLNIVK
jgi:hypothetical protein